MIQAGVLRVRVEIQLQGENEAPGTLPEDYRDGVLRYVLMGYGDGDSDSVDRNPCCGTHEPCISSLGSVFIFPTVSNISGPTRYRILFAIGNAVLAHFLSSHSILKEVGSALACGPNEITERLSILQKSKKDGLKREKNLKNDALRALSNDLIENTKKAPNGMFVGSLHREDENTDSEFMYQIITGALASLSAGPISNSSDLNSPSAHTSANGSAPDAIASTHAHANNGIPASDQQLNQPPAPPHIFILSSGPTQSTMGSGGCVLITGSEHSLVTKLGEAIRSHKALGVRVKGGGKNGRWQGKVVGCWTKNELDELERLVGEVTGAGTGIKSD